jgi:tetratricopeptide (TPR) repeat protein/transcriptional regulator with XRE-family HTH domain
MESAEQLRALEQLRAFGEFLRERRKALNKSANQVAVDAHITSAYLYMLEGAKTPKTGKAIRPSPEVLDRLAQALGLPLSTLALQVGYTGLEVQYPWVRSTRRAPLQLVHPSQVPASAFDDGLLIPPSRLIGRDVELAWVLNRLRAASQPRSPALDRITALRGMGGVGKTALAAVVFQHARDEAIFPDSMVVVNGQDESDAVDVLQSVLERFDPEQSEPWTSDPTTLEQVTRGLLSGRRVLIILDDLEPELDIKRVATPLLSAGATLLLCARHTLPRTVVPVEATLTLEGLPQEQALDLFAHAYGRGDAAHLKPAEREGAEEIVRLLAGHTLAVKLAGAHAADTGRDLKALARELDGDSSRKLNLPEEVTPEVDAVFSTSLNALPEDAKRLFAALAAFGTEEFGRAATIALAGALGLERPDYCVNLLVRRAVLNTGLNDEQPDGSDRERLQLHPLLQVFAEQQFAGWTADERDAAYRAIADHYITYVGRVAAQFATALYERALAPDDDNVGRAIHWAHDRGDRRRLEALCAGLSRFWHDREHFDDILEFLPLGIEAAEQLLDERALATTSLAGEQLSEAARSLVTELFWMVLNYGTALRATEKLDAADESYRRSLDLARRFGMRYLEGVALARLGQFAFERGKTDEAEAQFQRALQIHREVGNRPSEAAALRKLGRVALLRGRLADAEELCAQALDHAQEAGDRRGIGRARTLQGQIALRRGELELAETALRDALERHQQIQSVRNEVLTLVLLGDVEQRRKEIEAADRYYQRAIERAEAASHKREQGMIQARRGVLVYLRGEFEDAATAYREALAIAGEVEDRETQAMALAHLGELALRAGRADRAEDRLRRALELHRQIGDRPGQACDLALLAAVALARGALDQAEASLAEARAIPEAKEDVQVAALIQQQSTKLADARHHPHKADR